MKYFKRENWHQEANLLPLMNDGALNALAEDIAKHGIEQPIVLFEGKVLDGRNRLRACQKKGITLARENFEPFHPNGFSAREFVFTNNLHRRQLTIDQRAALAAELVPRFTLEAKQRQVDAGRKHGAEGGRGHKKEPSAKKRGKGLTAAGQAALFVGDVSDRYVELVISLEKKKRGTLKRIKNGEITLREAQREIDALFTHPEPLSKRFKAPMLSVLDAK